MTSGPLGPLGPTGIDDAGAPHAPIERLSTSEAYTAALAQGFASLLRPGDVVALEGDLGAGKTTFVRAVAEALGVVRGLVSSPTFVFVNQYPIAAGHFAGGQLVHVDAYRLTSAEDLEALGWDQLFEPATRRAAGRGAALIEWPRRIEAALPDDAAWVEMVATGASERRIVFRLPRAWEARAEYEYFTERAPVACRVTGAWVSPTARTWPFATDRARDADMYQWFTGGYKTSRDAAATDTPEE